MKKRSSPLYLSGEPNYWIGNPKRQDYEKKIIDASYEAMVALNKKAYCGMGTTMALIAIDWICSIPPIAVTVAYITALNMVGSVASIICVIISRYPLKAGLTLLKDSFTVSLNTFPNLLKRGYRPAADS